MTAHDSPLLYKVLKSVGIFFLEAHFFLFLILLDVLDSSKFCLSFDQSPKRVRYTFATFTRSSLLDRTPFQRGALFWWVEPKTRFLSRVFFFFFFGRVVSSVWSRAVERCVLVLERFSSATPRFDARFRGVETRKKRETRERRTRGGVP